MYDWIDPYYVEQFEELGDCQDIPSCEFPGELPIEDILEQFEECEQQLQETINAIQKERNAYKKDLEKQIIQAERSTRPEQKMALRNLKSKLKKLEGPKNKFDIDIRTLKERKNDLRKNGIKPCLKLLKGSLKPRRKRV